VNRRTWLRRKDCVNLHTPDGPAHGSSCAKCRTFMHAEPIQRQQEGVPGGEEQLLDKRRAKMTETSPSENSSLVETFFSNMKSISYHDPWLKSGRR
jgi:hypothetical protein